MFRPSTASRSSTPAARRWTSSRRSGGRSASPTDKTVGTIVIPVFIDTDTDPEAALDDSAFKPVWDVIQALRAHDEELGEQLDDLRREMGRHGGGPEAAATRFTSICR